MIDKIMDLVPASVDWWHGFLGPLCAPTPIFTIFGVTAVIFLFAILRWQYKHWGNMWAGEGIAEIFGAGFSAAIVTAVFYMLPLAVWVIVASVIASVFVSLLTKLVKISVGEY